MNSTSKRNAIVSALLVIALCVSLMAGATFALFTSESTVNVAVSSGKVSVVATLQDLKTYHLENASDPESKYDTGFHGGEATIVGDTLTLSDMVPGDKATFKIVITNYSTVPVKYKTAYTQSGDADLLAALNISCGNSTTWLSLDAADENGTKVKTIECSVELPFNAGNAVQEKACSLSFAVNAVQGNAETATVSEPEPVISGASLELSNTDSSVTATVSDTLATSLSGAGITEVSLACSKPQTANNTVTFDSVEIVDKYGNILDLSKYDGKITITLPVPGIENDTEVVVFHDGKPMGNATVENGQITYTAEHLCKIEIRSDCAYVTTLDQFTEAVNGAYTTVILGDDIVNDTPPHDGGDDPYHPYLIKDQYTIKKGQELTIDLNGETYAASVRLFKVLDGGKLTITSSRSGGKITINTTDPDFNYAKDTVGMQVNKGGALNIEENVAIEMNVVGVANPVALCWNNGTVNINGAELIVYGSAVFTNGYSNFGTFNMNGGKIVLESMQTNGASTGFVITGGAVDVNLNAGSIVGKGLAYKALYCTPDIEIAEGFVINTTQGPNT